MINLRQQKGQAMVEAVGALWILILVFFCIYYLFLMAIDKIRSLDTAYHLARVEQVQINPTLVPIELQCFGRLGMPQKIVASNSTGPHIDEITFQFIPRSFRSVLQPWKSVMRFAEPDWNFLDRSWPQAQVDTAPGLATLAKETALAVAKAQANSDGTLDAAEDVTDTLKAERG
jgi:hypothetical protein